MEDNGDGNIPVTVKLHMQNENSNPNLPAAADSHPPCEYRPGDAFTFTFPFVRDTFTEMDNEGSYESPTWKPGVRFQDVGSGDYVTTATYADGLGFQTVTVVGSFKPGRYPERVFFTRKWTDPDGKEFGKGKLHITTKAAFRTLVRGYRHDYKISDLQGALDCVTPQAE